MLGKLLKYEFKATGRIFLPLFAVAIILTPLFGALSLLLDSKNSALSLVSGLSIFGYVVLLLALGVGAFVLIFVRFYRSTTKDSAYLLFTLPVKTHNIITSKLIVALVWQIAAVIIIGLSVLTFTYMHGLWSFSGAANVWDFLKTILNTKGYSNIVPLVCLYLGAMLIGAVTSTLQIFASIGLGQSMKNHRVLFSIMYYILTYMALQLVTTLVLLPFLFGTGVMHEQLQSTQQIINYQYGVMGISLALNIVFGVAFFFITNYCYKKKLNLE